MSDIFEEVVDRWTSNDAWQFASKEAAWGYFFMAGRESQQDVISAQCVNMNKYDGIVESLRAENEALKQQVEQIEQETAEACAKHFGQHPHVEHFGDNIAEAIRSGAWKEFKK